MRRQNDDHEAIRARVAALPAAWYSGQPIPLRLLAALAAPRPASNPRKGVPLAMILAVYPPKPKRSAVELAHVRATNRLIRRAK